MAFAHGKVILLGEHAVVHGQPAIALASAPYGAEVTAARREGPATTLQIEPWGVHVDTGEADHPAHADLQRALRIARAFYKDELEVAIEASVSLPGGAGMGSSAALGVAMLRALDDVRGLSRPQEELFERSLALEKVFHGNPSGVDNALATYGGIALFKRGSPLTNVLPKRPVKLVVSYSGPAPSTQYMVDSVARQFRSDPERVGGLFEAIGSIVRDGKDALEHGELEKLGRLMDHNHQLLTSLMLSTATLEEMIDAAMAAGALGAKVTGAGGGGCMVALVADDAGRQKVGDALRALGKPVYELETK
jgi:mevalonate kinase